MDKLLINNKINKYLFKLQNNDVNSDNFIIYLNKINMYYNLLKGGNPLVKPEIPKKIFIPEIPTEIPVIPTEIPVIPENLSIEKIKYTQDIPKLKLNWKDVINFVNNITDNTLKETAKKFFLEYRKKVVDSIINKIITDTKVCTTSDTCPFTPSGTVEGATISSDYDLTIINYNLNTSTIINQFNYTIKIIYWDQPSIIFDTNLYGYGFLIEKKNDLLDKQLQHISIEEKKYYYFTPSGYKSVKQDKWALNRLLSFKTGSHYIESKNEFNTTPNNGNYITALEKFEDAMKKLDTQTMSRKGTQTMSRNGTQSRKGTLKGTQSINGTLLRNGTLSIKGTKTMPINGTLTETPPIINNDVVIDLLSTANSHADETYFTQGAFVHVVGTMFFFKKVTPEQYNNINKISKDTFMKGYYFIHSMIENLAYTIHTLDKCNGEHKCGTNIENNDILKASKYIARFYDAIPYICNLTKTKFIMADNQYECNLITTADKNLISVLSTVKTYLRNQLSENTQWTTDFEAIQGITKKINGGNNTNILEAMCKILSIVINNSSEITSIKMTHENNNYKISCGNIYVIIKI